MPQTYLLSLSDSILWIIDIRYYDSILQLENLYFEPTLVVCSAVCRCSFAKIFKSCSIKKTVIGSHVVFNMVLKYNVCELKLIYFFSNRLIKGSLKGSRNTKILYCKPFGKNLIARYTKPPSAAIFHKAHSLLLLERTNKSG